MILLRNVFIGETDIMILYFFAIQTLKKALDMLQYTFTLSN